VLRSLSVSNYALIDRLHVDWQKGFTVITGETGSGKSILLGALGLLTGDRADTKVLRNIEEKCIVEGEFDLSSIADIRPLFEEYDIDFSDITVVRREINPQGKSRSFINDTPVNLQVLKELGVRLIDIHSQHENFLINDKRFVTGIVDIAANTLPLLNKYQEQFLTLKGLVEELKEWQTKAEDAQKDVDFLTFQLGEFEGVNWEEWIDNDVEEEYSTLTYAEEIKNSSLEIIHYLDEAPVSVMSLLSSALQTSSRFSGKTATGLELFHRLEAIQIELKDVLTDFQRLQSSVEIDKNKLARLDELMAVIHRLQKKHHLNTVQELLEKRADMVRRLADIGNVDDKLSELARRIEMEKVELMSLGKDLAKQRSAVYESLENTLNGLLVKMNMPNARIKIMNNPLPEPSFYGLEEIMFYAQTNLGSSFEPLKKIASGGELSRVMLAIKSLQTQSGAIPTLLFDEIDTGVSGEVAHAMGEIMRGLSKNVQIISITHLAQIAGKGNCHFKVFKDEVNAITQTNMVELTTDQRVVELAEMISGKNPSDTALATAKELLRY
jgi:DNA repair protein RecN (Recombination protein N)